MTYVETARKEIKTNWPITEGLTAKTEKQTGRVMNLIPTKADLTPSRDRIGL